MKLTPNEMLLVKLVGQGMTNKEIAIYKKCKWTTVGLELTILFEKMGVEDRTQLAIKAFHLGFIQ